ncbi:hypothetical protein BDU57DRAFT_441994 [Ampelomyces quisqualis]|uniref:Uncharacterized protein n=1 Tax=Ampelomyces quisqualis TaxID=50730 RepID=A0A6A5QSL0_AMPQU|nr:hypothetical protein BDU57DRAFT_441994 [Ampelomyces quisqualis]
MRQSTPSALRSPLTRCPLPHGARRAFSATCPCPRGALPVFLPPSKPELGSLLHTLNAQVLLPCHLTKAQQKLVYRKENTARLEAEPVEITLGDVTLALEHLDPNRLPNRWTVLRSIVAQSETREDWENVVRAMEGFQNAGVLINAPKQGFIVRRMGAHGMQHLVLKALQRAKATGLRMREQDVVLQVLRCLYEPPAMSDWDDEETKKAFRMAKQVAELLEDPEHHATAPRLRVDAKHDFRGDPAFIAVPTALAAVLALRHGADAADVKTLAGRLVAALQQTDYNARLDDFANRTAPTEQDFKSKWAQAKYVQEFANQVPEIIFITTALRTAKQVLNDDMPMATEAQQYESRSSQVLGQCLAAINTLQSRGGEILAKGVAEYVKQIAEKSP